MLNQVLRYAAIARLLWASPYRRLLEVGSGSRGISGYLPRSWEITACDISFDDYGGRVGVGCGVRRVTGSVLDLPFADGEFDVVLAIDLLEHIPAEARGRAANELRRVTARRLILGCPCGADGEAADRALATFYDRLGEPHPGWLAEHLEFRLPRSGALTAAVRPDDSIELVANTAVASQLRIMRWEARPYLQLLVIGTGSVLGSLIRRGGLAGRVAVVVADLLAGRHRAPAYRQFIVIDSESH